MNVIQSRTRFRFARLLDSVREFPEPTEPHLCSPCVPSPPLDQQIRLSVWNPGDPLNNQLDRIILYVCGRCEIGVRDIRSRSRLRHVSQVRFVVAWLARQLTPASYPAIAAAIGYEDHTSAIHGYHRALELRRTYKHHRQMMDQFRKELSEEFIG